ncbi:hypothetical protein EV714DRAFT_287106 [Schizophyllum commune]
MSQRSRLPPQQSAVDEQPSTDAEQPSKPDLMCPTCSTFLVNVGNLNRHRRDLHRWVNPDNKRSRKAQPTQLALSERHASGHPLNASEPASSMTNLDLPIISPYPPLQDLVDTHLYSSDGQAPSYPQADISSGHVDDATANSASYVQIEAPTPIRLPALTNSTLLSASSDPLATPSPPCVVRTLRHTLGGNISLRENHSFATSFSSPVDDSNHPSDAMDAGGITDHGDFSIFESGTTHSSAHSHRSTEYDVVKGSHYTLYQSQRAGAPRHLIPLSIAAHEYDPHFWPTTHALPLETMHFPLVPPPQPGLFQSDATEVGYGQEQQAEAYCRQQELALQPQVASAQHGTARGPHHERNVGMFQARQQQQESHSRIWPMRESHAPTQQYAGASAPTHVPTRMDFDQLQVSTSYPQQAYYTPLFSPQSGDHLVCLSEQAPYQRSARSASNSQLFPAFDSHRHSDSGECLQARYASFDEITHYLNDPANNAPNFFFGNFKSCRTESAMSAY